MALHNAFYAQSGGVTAVINASACGVIEACRQAPDQIGKVYAGHNGIIGAHPAVTNLLFANGFSGHGLQQSPAVGRALSELVAHGAFQTLDLSDFGWQRVLKNRPLLEINVV